MGTITPHHKSLLNKSWIIFLLTSLILAGISLQVSAQIENLVVETYYISDVNDATDTTQGRSLQSGMKTYRVFLDLAPGSKLVKIFGSPEHPLKISSTSDFYNNIDRPNSFFGYLMNKSWFDDNPTIALDSWLTIGLAAQGQLGVLKSSDTNGVFNEILNNAGGTAVIAAGLLRNTDPLIGIPLNVQDGYNPFGVALGQWLDLGIKDVNGDDSTVFGSINIGNEFLSYEAFLQQSDGVESPGNNLVLVAQLTTLGDLTLKLNVVINEWDGAAYNAVTYVSNNDTLLPGELLSPVLSYPALCGCLDPNYIEFSNAYACNIQDSCQTPVLLGCMDPLACNYDPLANYNVQDLCCYPGYCGDRDLMVVCPGIVNGRFGIRDLHPNPAINQITMSLMGFTQSSIQYRIVNVAGQVIIDEDLGVIRGPLEIPVSVEHLTKGVYQLIVYSNLGSDNKTFVISE